MPGLRDKQNPYPLAKVAPAPQFYRSEQKSPPALEIAKQFDLNFIPFLRLLETSQSAK